MTNDQKEKIKAIIEAGKKDDEQRRFSFQKSDEGIKFKKEFDAKAKEFRKLDEEFKNRDDAMKLFGF